MSEFKYGLNLLVYTAAFSADQLDLVAKVADMGYDGVEVPFNDLSILDPAATRKACQAAGVDMTACCVIMPGESISSPDADQRVRGVERLRRMIDITAEMGGNIVSGPLYAPVGHMTGKARTEEEWNWCADGLAAGAEHAASAGVTLVIEPLNRFETYLFNTAADAVKLVETVGSENLKIQIDTFHGNIEEKDTAAAIRATGKWLGHFHASESDRGVLGTGQVRWSEVFAALHEIDYSGWVTIESFATGILDLCAAACIWRPIYESADGLAIDGLAFLKQAAQA
ncbi:MAG: sugar phosphate isomerase/epimerase family protein [Phycisphaerae bacterium]|jgi:D-psicose/D-tagatose/L-ribulose 3-epimerase|nr:sugar phosphate isomerase/epimerase family protein [Phycisphaerae bacterium]